MMNTMLLLACNTYKEARLELQKEGVIANELIVKIKGKESHEKLAELRSDKNNLKWDRQLSKRISSEPVSEYT